MSTGRARVKSGLDRLVLDDFSPLHGKRVAIVANQASVDGELHHIVDLVAQHPKCTLTRIFAPEHGLRGALQDMESVQNAVDPRTNVPVVSLYGNSEASLHPSPEALQDIDVILFDLQDVGSRYYTFSQTLAYTMQAAAKVGCKVLVLDRPNPIGGKDIEGAMLTAGARSFCGLFPVANRHGLTMGELAKLTRGGFGEGADAWPATPCDLEVVTMEGWRREMYYDETGLPWVLPSPNMPTLDTAIVYPGTCLFEATNLSEGRGTTRPFEFVGAPFLDGYAWVESVQQLGIGTAGATLRPMQFVPKFQKLHDRACSGVQIHVTDRRAFRPFRLGLALVATAYALAPGEFSWRRTTYEFVDNVPAIDLLYGSSALRKTIETKRRLEELLPEIERFEGWYTKAREPFLLYT